MLEAEIIQEFLVGLGFDVDEASLAKFNKAIESAAAKVVALGVAIEGLAAGIFYAVSKVSDGFENMGYEFHLIAPTINRIILLRRELLHAYSAAGISIEQAIRQSVLFNFSMTRLQYTFQALYKSIVIRVLPLLITQMDKLRATIYKHMPQIQELFSGFVTTFIHVAEVIFRVGWKALRVIEKLYGYFIKLDKATDGWASKLVSFISVWKLLGLEFSASHLLLSSLIGALTFLFLLWDDYQASLRGAKTHWNWNEGGLTKLITGLETVRDIMTDIKDLAITIFKLFFNPLYKFELVKNALQFIGGKIQEFADRNNPDNLPTRFTNENSSLGRDQTNFLNSTGSFNPTALPASNRSDYNLASQTTINVQGSADPNATAIAVAGQQTGVNRNLVRNLRPVIA